MCCHSLNKFLHKARKIFLIFAVIPLTFFTYCSNSGRSDRTQDHTESYFSPSVGVAVKSNTFLLDLLLYECVLHNALSDRTLDFIQVSLHFFCVFCVCFFFFFLTKEIQNTKEIKRMLFNKTEQDKTCKFSM